MHGRERVRGPDGEHHDEDEAGEIDGTASAEAGVATDEDHEHVSKPHGDREQHFRVCEEGRADGLKSEHGADKQTGGHAGQTEAESVEGDLVEGFERRQPGDFLCSLGLESALFYEIEQAGDEGEKERGIGREQKCDVQEQPARAERVGDGFVAGMEGRNEGKQHGNGQKEDAKRDSAVVEREEDEGGCEEETEK